MDSAPSLAAWRGRSSPTGRRGARSRPRPRPPCPRRRGRGRGGRDRSGSPRPRSARSCGRPVSAATEFTVALKMSFDHCAGRRSRKRLDLEPRRPDQRRRLLDALVRRVLVRAEPRLGVEDVLDVRVVVAGAAHERDGGDDRPVAVARERSPRRRGRSASSSSSPRESGPRASSPPASRPGAFVARMPRSNGGISAGSLEAVIDAVQVAAPAHARGRAR